LYRASIASDGKWHVYLYNYQSGVYDDIFTSASNTPRSDAPSGGWSMYESYQWNDCKAQINNSFQERLELQDSSGNWSQAVFSDFSSGPLYLTPTQDCFEASNGTGYYAHTISGFSGWPNHFSMVLTRSPSAEVRVRTPVQGVSGRNFNVSFFGYVVVPRGQETSRFIKRYEIDWGDGVIEGLDVSASSVSDNTYAGSHTYQKAGLYTVIIRAIDSLGGSGSTTLTQNIN
jgi:hypothetical protein